MNRPAYRIFALGLILLACATSSPAFAETEGADEQAAELAGRAEQWILDLDSDEFAVRETASANLAETGLPALEQVAAAARDGSLESTTRALRILLGWSKNPSDAELRIAALKKLVELSRWPRSSPASSELPATAPAELDSDDFSVRENACSHLLEVGLDALDRVAEVADNGSLESSTRALNILLSWSERASEPELRVAALNKVVELSNWPKESQIAGELLATAREEAALEKLLSYGGQCMFDTQSRTPPLRFPGGVVRPLQVTIGKQWRAGVEGLAILKDFRRMVTLSFHSSAFGEEILPVLKSLPQLRRIELYGTRISKKTATEWQSHLTAQIDFRSGAKLGIRGNQGAVARVMEVVSGTAAEKAGLKQRDIITHIDGAAVGNFEELTRYIGNECTAGESVMLKVKREIGRGPKTKDMEIKVTFDLWGGEEVAEQVVPEQVMTPLRISFDRR